MKSKSGLIAALIAGAMLTACASTGTKVSASSEVYRDMAKSQQWWCSSFSGSCGCSIDGQATTCSLVAACMNSGNCRAAP